MPSSKPPDVEKLRKKRSVRGLIRALGYEQDAKVRRAAAEALGSIGHPRAVGPLITALNDPDLRASLAPKGEAVLALVNQPMMLETATLRLDVLVTEMTYGAGAEPSNSFFDRLTIELVARSKEGEAPVEDVL